VQRYDTGRGYGLSAEDQTGTGIDMTERITGLEHLGMGQNCFSWRIAPVVKDGPTEKALKYEKFKERQKIYQREYRRMKKDAMRVNPESNICKSPITNSQKAPR